MQHGYHTDSQTALLAGLLALAVSAATATRDGVSTGDALKGMPMKWLHDLPSAGSTTLHDCSRSLFRSANGRTLCAEVLEQAGEIDLAIQFARAECADPFNFTAASKVSRSLS